MKVFEKKRVFMNVSAVAHCCLLTGISYSLFTWAQSPLASDEVIRANHPIRLEITPGEFCKTDPVLNSVTRSQE